MLAALLAAAAVLLFIPGSPERRLRNFWVTTLPADARIRPRLPKFGARARLQHADARARVIDAISALAAELRSGQPPGPALLNSAGTPPVWPSALSALRLDGDIPEALRVDAGVHLVLRSLAACWEVGSASGTGLAAAVNRLAEASRAAEEVRGELEVQLAGPRATARTLAALPLVGLLLGILMGADPVSWLVGSSVGLGCLVGGVVLTGLGTLWTSRIVSAVERQL